MPRLLTGALKPPRIYRNLPVPGWFHESTSEALQNMELRPTDIVLCSWPKSGTHWVYRALRLLTMVAPPEPPMVLAEMLTNDASAEAPRFPPHADDTFPSYLERETDPRIIVSHATPELLPSFERAGKLVYVTRDPRDVVTSNYFFMGTPADGWDGSMRRFCAPADETPNAFGAWPEHVRAFEQLAARLQARAVIVEYEKMHEDLRGTLQRLAALIGPAAEARLEADADAIMAALGFDAMKADATAGHTVFLRKGVSGGWREHFSEEDERAVMEMAAARLPFEATSVAGVGAWRGRPT